MLVLGGLLLLWRNHKSGSAAGEVQKDRAQLALEAAANELRASGERAEKLVRGKRRKMAALAAVGVIVASAGLIIGFIGFVHSHEAHHPSALAYYVGGGMLLIIGLAFLLPNRFTAREPVGVGLRVRDDVVALEAAVARQRSRAEQDLLKEGMELIRYWVAVHVYWDRKILRSDDFGVYSATIHINACRRCDPSGTTTKWRTEKAGRDEVRYIPSGREVRTEWLGPFLSRPEAYQAAEEFGLHGKYIGGGTYWTSDCGACLAGAGDPLIRES